LDEEKGVILMLAEELSSLVDKIRHFNCEFQSVEVKAANSGCPTRLFDTLSSFSNQDSGGIIVFGLDEIKHFETVGVYDVQDLQHKVVEQCKQMEPPVRPLFTVCEVDGKTIVSAEIPSADIATRPVFYKGVGTIKGSYIRAGEADELMSEYEIYSYEAFRKRVRDDLRLVEDARLPLLDQNLLDKYLLSVKKERKNLSEHVTDQEIMELMGITINGIPTLTGVMVFSKYPQAYFPQLCIIAVVVPGTEMGDTGSGGERFIANERMTGTIPEMLKDAIDFVRRNGRRRTIISEDGKRNDRDEYPMIAIREAVLNALIHRDYSVHTENVPTRIVMYSDRLEITNSGGLYGRISIDSLGKVRPDTRNPALANVLELLNTTENRYSGIPTIRKEMKAAGLPDPVFAVKRGEFMVEFKNGMSYPGKQRLVSEKTGNLEDQLLEFCRTPRTRKELVNFTGFSRFYTMDSIIKPLLESGKLKMTLPDKPKSKNQKYGADM
jgi:ATP-dependent DNA helicase RecG